MPREKVGGPAAGQGKVEGIDLILSATPTPPWKNPSWRGIPTSSPLVPYCEKSRFHYFGLGRGRRKTVKDYHLTPIDQSLAEEGRSGWPWWEAEKQVDSSYLFRL